MKNSYFRQVITSCIIIFSMTATAYPCTIFSLYPDNQQWVGRTFDWDYGHGLVYTNKRNVAKMGVTVLPTDVASSWVSKYGSVTFNQFGREFPTGGMNEEGLVVDALELKESVFPKPDSRPSLNELQFIQYILDNYASVEEIASDLPKLRLSPLGSALHYFACDVKKCMTIEFIKGELAIHINESLPISGLANNTYAASEEYARRFIPFGGTDQVIEGTKVSLDRFVRSNARAMNINNHADKVQALFRILDDVGGNSNRWQLIYNQDEKTITFRTTAKFDKQRKVELQGFDFSCKQSSQYYDLDSESSGKINSEFKDFDFKTNQDLVVKSITMQKMPLDLAYGLARYPLSTICK